MPNVKKAILRGDLKQCKNIALDNIYFAGGATSCVKTTFKRAQPSLDTLAIEGNFN